MHECLQAFASAQAALALRTAFEDSIDDSKPADEALLAAMWAYIRFERSQGAAGWPRVRLILERAAARFPVTVQLWQELIAHVEGGADASAASVATLCWRASRNCPWSGEVWAARLRAVERQAAAEAAGSEAAETLLQEHARIYEEALQVRSTRCGNMVACLCSLCSLLRPVLQAPAKTLPPYLSEERGRRVVVRRYTCRYAIRWGLVLALDKPPQRCWPCGHLSWRCRWAYKTWMTTRLSSNVG